MGPSKMGNEQAFRMLRHSAWRLAGWQLVVTVLVSAGAALIGGRVWALSALAGGGIAATAGLYQALRMFRIDASRDPERYMSSVYVSEALKIVLTVALFIAAIRILRVELVPVIVAYTASYGVYWVALGTGYPWSDTRPGHVDSTDQGGK